MSRYWFLVLIFVTFYPLPGISLNTVVKEDCAPSNSSFHQYCICRNATLLNCGGSIKVEFTCSKLPRFFQEGASNGKVDCLRIVDSPLTTITIAGLEQFSNLTGLVMIRTGLSNISNGALDQLTSLKYLELRENRLTRVPYIRSLPKLLSIYLQSNDILSIDNRTFSGVNNLFNLDLHDNELTSLTGPLFSNNCFLQNIVFSNNRITEIEDEVFAGTKNIRELNLANTDISRMPAHTQLRQTVGTLDLSGCRNLKKFNFLTNGNKTFPLLKAISFQYHAHCCQLERLVEKENASRRNARSLAGNQEARRTRRDVSANSSLEGAVCVNASSLECVSESVALATNVTWFNSAGVFCSLVVGNSSCSACLDIVCTDMCSSNSSSPMENSNTTLNTSSNSFSNNEVLCLVMVTPSQSSPIPEPSRTSMPVTITTMINHTFCFNEPASSTCNPLATPTPNRENNARCIVEEFSAECVQVITEAPPTNTAVVLPTTTPVVTPTIAVTTPTATPVATPTATPATTLITTIEDPPVTTTEDPPTTPPTTPPDPITNCMGYCFSPIDFGCIQCNSDVCQDAAGTCSTRYPQFCRECHNVHNKRRRKRSVEIPKSTDEEVTRYRRQVNLPDIALSPVLEWFPNYSDPFCCSILPPDNGSDIPPLTCNDIVPPEEGYERDFADVMCAPGEDPFNPCLDLLGSSDALRAAIWLVIIFAFMGNSLVFVVFIGYSVIIRKAAQEMFTVHFMYFNLALADFFMGMYLFIIAIVDADTKGEFYLSDISWRTGHGCGFAGFCAILSTVVSVYVLLVITLERMYTIVKVFKRKKLTKKRVSLIMGAGWVFGAVIAALPLLGVSDYDTVAICLPFNVEEGVDLAYIVSLLLATGVAFTVIAICYAIIFQQVFCNSNKVSPVSDGKRRSADIKITVRILILVLTNFVCWFPISLLGLSAAFGKSLVDNLEFARWAMVFIFPINACLNPFLYSLTTRMFRDQFVLLLSRCGLCTKRAQRLKNAQIGITPSFTSKTSNTSGGFTNSKFVARLRSFSIVSQTSSVSLLNLMNRRSSEASQFGGSTHRMNFLNSHLRRTSNVSSASSDEMTNSRRGSTFSANSNDASTTFYNVGYVSNGSLEAIGGGTTIPDLQSRSRAKISASSLGALPEEVEFPVEAVAEEGVVKVNPVYIQEDEEVSASANRQDSGMVEDEEEEEMTGEADVIINVNAFHLDTKKNDEDTESGSASNTS